MPDQQPRSTWLWPALAALLVVAGMMAWSTWPRSTPCSALAAGDRVASSSAVRLSIPPPLRPHVISLESGQARYHTFAANVACSFPERAPDGVYAGISAAEYGQADRCGSYLDIQGPRGQVRAEIVDRCAGCGPGVINLSPVAIARIGGLSTGTLPIDYTEVRDPLPAPRLSYRVKPGSSADRLGLLIDGSGNPIHDVTLQVTAHGPWLPLTRGVDNYWSATGTGPGPFDATVTDVYGRRVQLSGIALLPGRGRLTDTRLYPGAAGPDKARTARPEPVAGRIDACVASITR